MQMRRRLWTLTLVAALAGIMASVCSDATAAAGQVPARANSGQKENTMKIRMDIEGTAITATLADNATTRDFVSLLPLTLTLKDYAGTEKVSDLPRKLSTEGAPAGANPAIGDITYYAPWGNLAIFYRDFGYARGLVMLGKIDDGMDILSATRPLQVKIELVK